MVQIEKLIPGGQALGTLNDPASPDHGKKVFLWNALPGETVTAFDITKRKSSYLEGIATTIQNPSPNRVAPQDSLYLSTSPWQIMGWDYELAQKRLLVEESLRQAHIPLDNLEIRPTQTDGKQWGYRNKMEYALYWDNTDSCIYLAFRARGSHRKLPLKPHPTNALTSLQEALQATSASKPLMSSLERPELLKAALKCVRELNSHGEEARKYQSLLLRCNQSGQVSGGLLENHQPHPIFNNLSDTLLGRSYSYSPNGFFQINLPVYELALQEIRQHIFTTNVLDLYAGVGTIGLSVAADKNLTLVECNASAYAEMVKNSHSSQAVPVLARSEDSLNYIKSDQTVILDPPRAGCTPELITRLNQVKPTSIIYLSCNPVTQARDVSMLLPNYAIKSITPFNFFPKTPHIENLIVLSRV